MISTTSRAGVGGDPACLAPARAVIVPGWTGCASYFTLATFSGRAAGSRPARDRWFESVSLQWGVHVSRDFAFPRRKAGFSCGCGENDHRVGATRRECIDRNDHVDCAAVSVARHGGNRRDVRDERSEGRTNRRPRSRKTAKILWKRALDGMFRGADDRFAFLKPLISPG